MTRACGLENRFKLTEPRNDESLRGLENSFEFTESRNDETLGGRRIVSNTQSLVIARLAGLNAQIC